MSVSDSLHCFGCKFAILYIVLSVCFLFPVFGRCFQDLGVFLRSGGVFKIWRCLICNVHPDTKRTYFEYLCMKCLHHVFASCVCVS